MSHGLYVILNKTPPSQKLGCLLGLMGAVGGCTAGSYSFSRHAAETLAQDPDAWICGNPAVAAMGGGVFLGGLLGVLLGVVLDRVMRRRNK